MFPDVLPLHTVLEYLDTQYVKTAAYMDYYPVTVYLHSAWVNPISERQYELCILVRYALFHQFLSSPLSNEEGWRHKVLGMDDGFVVGLVGHQHFELTVCSISIPGFCSD